jgi:hypothetical protein
MTINILTRGLFHPSIAYFVHPMSCHCQQDCLHDFELLSNLGLGCVLDNVERSDIWNKALKVSGNLCCNILIIDPAILQSAVFRTGQGFVIFNQGFCLFLEVFHSPWSAWL